MDLRMLACQDWPQIPSLTAAAINAGSIGHYSKTAAGAWDRSHGLDTILRAERTLVLSEDSKVLAIAGANSRTCYHLSFVFVMPERWRQGLGSVLVRALECFCVTRGVAEMSVAASRNAVNFYRALGYTRNGDLQLLMPVESVGESTVEVDAIAMSKRIRPIGANGIGVNES